MARSRFARALKFIVFAVLVVLCCSAFWLRLSSKNAPPVLGLVVTPADLDVGDVWEQNGFQRNITIRNTGSSDIAIERFSSTCGCVSIEPPSLMIPSGKEAVIRLTLNVQVGSRYDGDSEDFRVEIAPQLGDGSSRQPVWTVRGRARRLIKLTPRAVSFYGDNRLQGEEFPSQTVIASPTIALDSLALVSPTQSASVHVTRRKESPNEFQIHITPQKTLPVGPFRFDVVLEPSSGGIRYPTVTIPVEGIVVGDVHALPESLILGARKVGEIVTEMITLRSASNAPIDVAEVWTSSNDTVVEPSAVPGIPDKTFRVIQNIAWAGGQVSSIRFSVRNKGGGSSLVIVNVVYQGIP